MYLRVVLIPAGRGIIWIADVGGSEVMDVEVETMFCVMGNGVVLVVENRIMHMFPRPCIH